MNDYRELYLIHIKFTIFTPLTKSQATYCVVELQREPLTLDPSEILVIMQTKFHISITLITLSVSTYYKHS